MLMRLRTARGKGAARSSAADSREQPTWFGGWWLVRTLGTKKNSLGIVELLQVDIVCVVSTLEPGVVWTRE